jgi:hypothetical protein
MFRQWCNQNEDNVLSATLLSASERRRPLEILNKVGGIKAWKEY